MNAPIDVKKRTEAYLKHIGIDVDEIRKNIKSPSKDTHVIEIKRCPRLNSHWAETGEGEMLLSENNPEWSCLILTRSDGSVEMSFGTEELMKLESEKKRLLWTIEKRDREIEEKNREIEKLDKTIESLDDEILKRSMY